MIRIGNKVVAGSADVDLSTVLKSLNKTGLSIWIGTQTEHDALAESVKNNEKTTFITYDTDEDIYLIIDTIISYGKTWSSVKISSELAKKINASDVYTKEQVDEIINAKLASALKYRGAVNTTALLPGSAENGDTYFVKADGFMYAYNSTTSTWDALGTVADMTNYFTKTEITAMLQDKADKFQYDVLPTASSETVGLLLQYTGADTEDYKNSYFYKGIDKGNDTYGWELAKIGKYEDIINDSTTSASTTWSSEKISADLVNKQDFRLFKSLEEFNEKKGTSLTVVSGVDNMKDIANAMSNGEILIIVVKYVLGSEVYFGLTTSTGWSKMFTFIKSNGLCDVECRTTTLLTLKRVLNSDGVVGDWQQLVTKDDIFLVGDRRNTIGWADLSKDVNIDGSSNFANNVCRIEGHNALIEVSNPSIGYQWPVTNSRDNNAFVDFGGAIQFFTDKVNNHLYVRFANSVDMSAWGEIATMDKVNALHKQTVDYITGSLLGSVVKNANLYYQKFGDNRLVINGWVNIDAVSAKTPIFTLPNNWKADSNYLLPCYADNSNVACACIIDIADRTVKSYTPLPATTELRFCGEIYLM